MSERYPSAGGAVSDGGLGPAALFLGGLALAGVAFLVGTTVPVLDDLEDLVDAAGGVLDREVDFARASFFAVSGVGSAGRSAAGSCLGI